MTNNDQEEFWTRSAGPAWVTYQAEMDALLTPVLDLVRARAALKPGEQVLDIGCGTGQSVGVFADAVGAQGHVTGLDISDTMLALAGDTLKDRGNTTLLLADAQTHAFAQHSFDALLSRFGVMFFEDTTAAFANLWGALKPGGRMVLAAWGPAPYNPWFMEPAIAARDILGPMPKVDRTQPGPFAFEDPARVQGLMAGAGIDAHVITEDIALTPQGSLQDMARLCCEIGPADSALRHFEATATQRAEVERAIISHMAKYDGPMGLKVPACIHVYTAMKGP